MSEGYNSMNQDNDLKSWFKNGKRCEKCNKDCSDIKYERNETYNGIDVHHNPPQFMFEKPEWVGELICLCRECHRKLHEEILKIMFKHSNLFKPKKSEHWTWIATIGEDRFKCRDEVYKFTVNWLGEKE